MKNATKYFEFLRSIPHKSFDRAKCIVVESSDSVINDIKAENTQILENLEIYEKISVNLYKYNKVRVESIPFKHK